MDAAASQCLFAASRTVHAVQPVYCCWQGVQQRSEQGMLKEFCIVCIEQKQQCMACIATTQYQINCPPSMQPFRGSMCVVGSATFCCCPCSCSCTCSLVAEIPRNFTLQEKVLYFRDKAFWWLFVVMNGNVCFQLLAYILSLVYTSMFVVLFVTMNFSAETTENGACIAVRVSMCVLIGKSNIRVVRVWGLKSDE